jgi:hypothetical protein
MTESPEATIRDLVSALRRNAVPGEVFALVVVNKSPSECIISFPIIKGIELVWRKNITLQLMWRMVMVGADKGSAHCFEHCIWRTLGCAHSDWCLCYRMCTKDLLDERLDSIEEKRL